MATNVPFDLDAAADLVDLSIQNVWLKSPADLQEYHKDFYYVEPVTDLIVKDSSLTSISTFSKVPENGVIPADSPHQGFDKTYTQSFFSGMLRITRPMWRYGITARRLESLSTELKNDAVRFKQQVLANVVVNNASTSYTETTGKFSYSVTNSGGDSAAMKSTSHTREDGGSNWSNVVSDGTTSNMDWKYRSPCKIISDYLETLKIRIQQLANYATNTLRKKDNQRQVNTNYSSVYCWNY